MLCTSAVVLTRALFLQSQGAVTGVGNDPWNHKIISNPLFLLYKPESGWQVPLRPPPWRDVQGRLLSKGVVGGAHIRQTRKMISCTPTGGGGQLPRAQSTWLEGLIGWAFWFGTVRNGALTCVTHTAVSHKYTKFSSVRLPCGNAAWVHSRRVAPPLWHLWEYNLPCTCTRYEGEV